MDMHETRVSELVVFDTNILFSGVAVCTTRPGLAAHSDEIVHLVRRKASTRSGSKNPVVSASPVDQVGAKRRAA